MKKQIPKFDQKAWDEKQAKISEEANGRSGITRCPVVSKSYMDEIAEQIKRYQEKLGNNKLVFIPSTMSSIKSSYDPSTGIYTLGDENDRYIFGGDSEDTMQLPKGYYDQTGFDWASTGASNPVKTNCELGNHSPVNVGFHHDKFVCKHCDKEQGK